MKCKAINSPDTRWSRKVEVCDRPVTCDSTNSISTGPLIESSLATGLDSGSRAESGNGVDAYNNSEIYIRS